MCSLTLLRDAATSEGRVFAAIELLARLLLQIQKAHELLCLLPGQQAA